MKQFKTKDELEMWVQENFPSPKEFRWELYFPDDKKVAEKLVLLGYDLDNLTEDGEAYEVDGHTNDGWMWEDEIALDCLDEMKAKGKVRVR